MAKEKESVLKISEMTNNAEVVKYDKDVSSLIKNYNDKIKKAKNNTDLSDMAFLDMGKKLIEIEKKINQDIQDDKDIKDDKKVIKARKIFAAFKLRIHEKINKNISNVDKVYNVAVFCETDTYKKYQDRLPSGWGTLYLLLSFKKDVKGENGEKDKKELDVEKIDQLMSDSSITKTITRSELIKKIDAIKNPNRVINPKVTIIVESGIVPTSEQLQELQKHLDEKFEQWKITKPDIKPEAPVPEGSENGETE